MASTGISKLRLNSDFHDYYDHMFDLEGRIYDRMSRSETRRDIIISQLENMGYWTPITGQLSFVAREMLGKGKQSAHEAMVVIHTDPTAHSGIGKQLLTIEQAYDVYGPDALAVQFIMPAEPNTSYRHLVIGRRCFRLKYTAFHDWRSNVGDGEIKVICECSGLMRRNVLPNVPLVAIDLIEDKSHWHWAIDLNVSPGLRNTGIEDFMTPTQVVTEIKKYYEWSDFTYRNNMGVKDARDWQSV